MKKAIFFLSILIFNIVFASNAFTFSYKNQNELAFVEQEGVLGETYKIIYSFKDDYPKLYNFAKHQLKWDYAFLNALNYNDTITFIFAFFTNSNNEPVAYKILGLSVKSKKLGNFSLFFYQESIIINNFFFISNNLKSSYYTFFEAPISFGKISSPFGKREDPFTFKIKFHKGIDIAAEKNTPVHSAEYGEVIFAGYEESCGKCVKIQHSNGYTTVYAHLNFINVAKNEIVNRGEVIGYVGKSGRATGYHLHFGVYRYGKAINPMNFTYKRNWNMPFQYISNKNRYEYKKRSMQRLLNKAEESGGFISKKRSF